MSRPAWVLVASLAATFALSTPAAFARTLVRYDKSGGIAGVQLSLTVSDRGAARAQSGRSAATTRFQLSAAQLRALQRALRDARFSTLHSRYDSSVPVADGFTESVAYGARSVTVATGGHPPARLRSLLARLGRLAVSHG